MRSTAASIGSARAPRKRPAPPTSIGARSDDLVTATLDRFEALDIDRVLAEGLHDTLVWIAGSTARIGDAIHADFFDPAIERAAQPPASSQSQG